MATSKPSSTNCPKLSGMQVADTFRLKIVYDNEDENEYEDVNVDGNQKAVAFVQ